MVGEPADAVLFRDRLLVSLDRAYRVRLSAIIADAGFGKSTLLETWASETNVAWLTLTEVHRQLGVFARHLTDRIRLRVPDLPRDLRLAVRAEQGPDATADETGRSSAYASLIADALSARLHRPLVLILDDLHELGDSGACVQLVEGLVRQAPALFHVVAASRQPVPFAIARVRARGQVYELGSSDMSFTLEEAAELLFAVLGETDRALAKTLWQAVRRLARRPSPCYREPSHEATV